MGFTYRFQSRHSTVEKVDFKKYQYHFVTESNRCNSIKFEAYVVIFVMAVILENFKIAEAF